MSSELRAPDTGPQVARRRDQGPSLLSELCQKHNSLASALYPAHYTLYSTIDNIGSELPDMRERRWWENQNCSSLLSSSASASAMIISGQCPGEGGEKCNKILLKNNIYSDQGPVPDVGITLPRGGTQANIFSFKLSKTLLFVLILIWQLLKKICFWRKWEHERMMFNV